MVFQSYAIYPHMSVRENIAFPLRIAKMSKAEITRRVNDAAEILELTTLLDRKPASLSGGQRQRVAMGRALVREPKVFLLDEPLSNLDARLRGQMRTEIARLHKRLGTTMIYVTHDQTEAMTLGDRLAVMNRGEVQQIGTPQTLYRHPANLFVASFIGSPSMNLLPAQITKSRLILPFGELELPEDLLPHLPDENMYVVAGIRPEHFQYVKSSGITTGELTFDVITDIAEWLGTELNLYFDVKCPDVLVGGKWPESMGSKIRENGSVSIVARLDPAINAGKGDRLTLFLDARKIHIFDRETGDNLMSGAG
jgi:multiple sugar transport system ATP-binding protein